MVSTELAVIVWQMRIRRMWNRREAGFSWLCLIPMWCMRLSSLPPHQQDGGSKPRPSVWHCHSVPSYLHRRRPATYSVGRRPTQWQYTLSRLGRPEGLSTLHTFIVTVGSDYWTQPFYSPWRKSWGKNAEFARKLHWKCAKIAHN